jgi:hypothetical protein
MTYTMASFHPKGVEFKILIPIAILAEYLPDTVSEFLHSYKDELNICACRWDV